MSPRCPVCRSKQWHKEPSSGLIACSEGHVLQNHRNEAAELGEDAGAHALKKRSLKSSRKGKARADSGPKLYYGERARYLYFQCQQLLLRQQVSSLTILWHLPPEFEVICRDLWALYLSILPKPPSAEPHFYGQDMHPEKENGAKSLKEELRGVGDDRFSSSSSESEDDSDLEELMRENSESAPSSSDEGGSNPVPKPISSMKEGLTRRHLARTEGPLSTVAVLMLTCWTMRLPVLYTDFIRIIESYDLPYLDPLRLFPHSMAQHLSKALIQSLCPKHAPNTLTLHQLTSRLAKSMFLAYDISIPELNATPVLWRVVRALGGTPMLYDLTKRLKDALDLTLTLNRSLMAKERQRESRKFDSAPPEVALIAATIIVLKMVYGLDGKPRRPKTTGDPACALPRVEDYLGLLKALDVRDAKTRDDVFSSETPMDVGDLSEEMLEGYLDFCEKALLAPDWNRKPGRNILDKHFPLLASSHVAAALDGRDGGQDLRPNSFNDTDGSLRPGELYAIYSARDVGGSLPDEYELVIRRSARWVRVGEDYLCRVVEHFERRMVRWWERKKQEGKKEADDHTMVGN